MRRAICFLLVLVFCLSMACPAFAYVRSPENQPPRPNYPHRPNLPGRPDQPVQPERPSLSDRWYPSFLGDNPKTGDIIMFWVLVLVASVVALGAVYFIYRRKFCK